MPTNSSDFNPVLANFRGSPKDITLDQVFKSIPRGWPIDNKDGKISIAVSTQDFTDGRRSGQTLAHYFMDVLRLSQPQTDAATKLLHDYVGALNNVTARIRRDTKITSHPEMVMSYSNSHLFSYQESLGWHALRNHLEASGARIIDLGAKGGTWSRDHYVMGADGTAYFLPASEKTGLAEVHNKAKTFIKAEFEKLGIPTKEITSSRLQGGDVLQHTQSNTVFVGIASTKGKLDQQSLSAAKELAGHLKMDLVPVPKTQRDIFYHLDTFMSVLPDGSAILLPDATNPQTLETIRQIIKPHGELLELPIHSKESPQFANSRRDLVTNIVTINGNSFTANALPEVKEFLASRGFNIIKGPYDSFPAGPHCQVNFIKRTKSDGRSDVASLHFDTPRLTVDDVKQPPESFRPNIRKQLSTVQRNQPS